MTLAALVDAGVRLDALNAAIGSLGLPGCRLVAAEVEEARLPGDPGHRRVQPEHAHRHLQPDPGDDRRRPAQPRGRRTWPGGSSPGWPRPRPRSTARRSRRSISTRWGRPTRSPTSWARPWAGTCWASSGWWPRRCRRARAGSASPTASAAFPPRPRPSCCAASRWPNRRSEGELTTPTGAAILATLADSFGPLPAMTIERIGYGAGQQDWPSSPTCCGCWWARRPTSAAAGEAEQVWVLETNLDDISGELVGYCIARLWEAGALDVYTTAIQMKKNRPGVKLSVLCRPGDAAAMEDILFRRDDHAGRAPLDGRAARAPPRSRTRSQTPWGPVEGKIGWLRDGTPRFAPEFESCRRMAEAQHVPLRESTRRRRRRLGRDETPRSHAPRGNEVNEVTRW